VAVGSPTSVDVPEHEATTALPIRSATEYLTADRIGGLSPIPARKPNRTATTPRRDADQ
jgi:hypothetical protein